MNIKAQKIITINKNSKKERNNTTTKNHLNGQNFTNNFNLKYCKIHRYNKINVLQFSEKSQNRQMCTLCLQNSKIESSEIISIELILRADEETVFENFPPLEDKQIQKTLNLFSNEMCVIDDKMKEMQNYFTELRQSFDKLISEMENIVKKQIITLYELKKKVIEDYNKISSKQELKQIFTEDQNEINEKLQELLLEKTKNKLQYSEIMRDSIQNLNNLYDQQDFKQADSIKKQTQELIQSINFFSSQINQDANKDDYFDLEENKDNIKNDEILYNLIANKTNYCSEETLKNIKQILSRNKIYLNRYKISNLINDEKKRNSFNQLENEQLENIRLLAEKIYEVDNQYKTNNNQNQLMIDKEIQSNSYFINQNSYILNENLIQILLRRYPIFEIVQFTKTIDLYQGLLLKAVDPSLFQIIHSTCLTYMISISSSVSRVYYNLILNPNKKYIFRIKCQYHLNSSSYDMRFGLLPLQFANSKPLSDFGLYYKDNNYQVGICQKIKGNDYIHNVYSSKEENRQFEIRIHLMGEILKVGDYPLYQKACQIQDKSKIKGCYQQGVFAIELYNIGDMFIIESIQEVLEFDDKM